MTRTPQGMTNSSDTSLTGPAQHVLQRQGEYGALRCSGTRKVSFTLFFLQNGCQKWNQRVQKWGIACIMWHHCWRIFDSFIAGSSAAFVLTVHHICTLIECNRFFYDCFSFFAGWPCTSMNTFYTWGHKKVHRLFLTR